MTESKFVALLKPYAASDPEIANIDRRLRALSGSVSDPKLVDGLIASIESKSGTLLSHTSTMIAVTGILLALTSGERGFEIAFALHLIVYVLLALLCIRCQLQFDTSHYLNFPEFDASDANSHHTKRYERALKSELFYKELVFRNTLKALYCVTFVLIISVFWAAFDDQLRFAGLNLLESENNFSEAEGLRVPIGARNHNS